LELQQKHKIDLLPETTLKVGYVTSIYYQFNVIMTDTKIKIGKWVILLLLCVESHCIGCVKF